MDIKAGDVVVLKSDGEHRMTVEDISTCGRDGEVKARCIYFYDGKLFREYLAPEALVKL